MRLNPFLSAFSVLAALTLSVPAFADIPPDDQCQAEDEGKACSNAGDEGLFVQPGVCQATMCTRATAEGPMSYPCHRCVAKGEGGAGGQPSELGGAGAGAETSSAGTKAAGGAPTSGGSGTTTAGTKSASGGSAGATNSESQPGDSGCSVSPARGGAGAFATLVALGFAAAGLWRRRSSAS